MIHSSLLAESPTGCRPVHLVNETGLAALSSRLSAVAQAYLKTIGYKAKPGSLALLPDQQGGIERVLFGVEAEGKPADPFLYGRLTAALPEGDYVFDAPPAQAELATLAFAMAAYKFTRYKDGAVPKARLVVPAGVDVAKVSRAATAVALGRDLINTPANDLGPEALAAAAISMAESHGAEVKQIIGDRLLRKNYPLIHAVGRAAAQAPQLIDLRWGNPDHPRVTLVGKGVCFDTGGLDLKPSSAMLLMKKDMGGAATALAAAMMIMGQGLKVRLRVLLPIVENSVAGAAFRPGDVLVSRKGLSVEIGNTDAEGRLILADALARADESVPDLLIDFATLTGAARVALGQDLPPFFTDDEALAADIARAGGEVNDPVWRLPLWRPYDALIESRIADIDNAGSGAGMAGAITAALFLRRFVERTKAYAHFDIYGWATSSKNGLPEGGNPQAARLVHRLVESRFG